MAFSSGDERRPGCAHICPPPNAIPNCLLGLNSMTSIIVRVAAVTCVVAFSSGLAAAERKKTKAVKEDAAPTAPTSFAPLPEEHELASIWNDPDFARRLVGSYGFAS